MAGVATRHLLLCRKYELKNILTAQNEIWYNLFVKERKELKWQSMSGLANINLELKSLKPTKMSGLSNVLVLVDALEMTMLAAKPQLLLFVIFQLLNCVMCMW